jgi:prefoldin subunit 5
MTDRYEKIRKALAKGPMQGPWGATLRDLLAERDALAAEVEALRAEVGRLQRQYDERTACMIVHRGQALACSDAVRAAYFDESRRADKLWEEVGRLRAEVDVLKAENARIREALQAIVDEVSGGLVPYSSDSYLPAHLVEQARAALAKENSND